MISRIKTIVIASIIAIVSLLGWHLYGYFYSETSPVIEIRGVEQDGSYAGEVQCIVKAKDGYKVKEISLWLDGKPLAQKCKINRKEFESAFMIPTKTLTNGKHTLLVEAFNGAYNKAKTSQEFQFTVDNLPLQAAFVRGGAESKVFQGRTLHVQFQVNKEIKQATAHALSKSYPCFKEAQNSLVYECFIPIECEEPANEYLLSIEIVDKVGGTMTLENKFQVVAYPFKKQQIKLDPEKMKTEQATGLPEKQFEAALEEITKKSPQQKLWQGVFVVPTELKDPKQITTEFGVIRITQESGLKAHKALDIYNTPKSVIWAPQDGIVVLKERYAHSGNTVVIDHGFGILTLLFHLDSFAAIEVGEKIKKGNPVGTLGKTGRATGYHIHWALLIQNVPVDPMQWTKRDF